MAYSTAPAQRLHGRTRRGRSKLRRMPIDLTDADLALGIVPTMVWGVLIVGALLTVGFTFFFGTAT